MIGEKFVSLLRDHVNKLSTTASVFTSWLKLCEICRRPDNSRLCGSSDTNCCRPITRLPRHSPIHCRYPVYITFRYSLCIVLFTSRNCLKLATRSEIKISRNTLYRVKLTSIQENCSRNRQAFYTVIDITVWLDDYVFIFFNETQLSPTFWAVRLQEKFCHNFIFKICYFTCWI